MIDTVTRQISIANCTCKAFTHSKTRPKCHITNTSLGEDRIYVTCRVVLPVADSIWCDCIKCPDCKNLLVFIKTDCAIVGICGILIFQTYENTINIYCSVCHHIYSGITISTKWLSLQCWSRCWRNQSQGKAQKNAVCYRKYNPACYIDSAPPVKCLNPIKKFYTSCIRGRGNIFSPVRLCVSLCGFVRPTLCTTLEPRVCAQNV